MTELIKRKIGVGTFRATPRMRELVDMVLDTGRLSYGPLSRALEESFADIHACQFGVLSNSGTSSLQVALQALKEIYHWHDGDEVLVPAVTFVATVNVVLHNNLTPVLVDVDPLYYEMNPAKVRKAITSRTRAMIPVHLFGQPADMEGLYDATAGKGIHTIEDSCETMFVTYDSLTGDSLYGGMVGSLSDIGCFSMYVAHLLTSGVGGIAITNIPTYASRMRSLVNHGRDGIYISIDDSRDATGSNLKEVISRRFKFNSVGHSFRITELEAAIALAQLETWPAMIAARKANADYLTRHLQPYEELGYVQLPHVRPGSEHAFMMYPLVMLNDDKAAFSSYLEERGIETREMLPLVNQPCYFGMWRPMNYPVAQWIDRCGLYIGCHQDLTEDDLAYIVEVIGDYFETVAPSK